jgi:hypothetical protein
MSWFASWLLILLFASPLAAQAETPEEALSSCLADSSMSMQPF